MVKIAAIREGVVGSSVNDVVEELYAFFPAGDCDTQKIVEAVDTLRAAGQLHLLVPNFTIEADSGESLLCSALFLFAEVPYFRALFACNGREAAEELLLISRTEYELIVLLLNHCRLNDEERAASLACMKMEEAAALFTAAAYYCVDSLMDKSAIFLLSAYSGGKIEKPLFLTMKKAADWLRSRGLLRVVKPTLALTQDRNKIMHSAALLVIRSPYFRIILEQRPRTLEYEASDLVGLSFALTYYDLKDEERESFLKEIALKDLEKMIVSIDFLDDQPLVVHCEKELAARYLSRGSIGIAKVFPIGCQLINTIRFLYDYFEGIALIEQHLLLGRESAPFCSLPLDAGNIEKLCNWPRATVPVRFELKEKLEAEKIMAIADKYQDKNLPAAALAKALESIAVTCVNGVEGSHYIANAFVNNSMGSYMSQPLALEKPTLYIKVEEAVEPIFDLLGSYPGVAAALIFDVAQIPSLFSKAASSVELLFFDFKTAHFDRSAVEEQLPSLLAAFPKLKVAAFNAYSRALLKGFEFLKRLAVRNIKAWDGIIGTTTGSCVHSAIDHLLVKEPKTLSLDSEMKITRFSRGGGVNNPWFHRRSES